MEKKDSLLNEQLSRINGGAQLEPEPNIDDRKNRRSRYDADTSEIEEDGKDVPGGNERWLI